MGSWHLLPHERRRQKIVCNLEAFGLETLNKTIATAGETTQLVARLVLANSVPQATRAIGQTRIRMFGVMTALPGASDARLLVSGAAETRKQGKGMRCFIQKLE